MIRSLLFATLLTAMFVSAAASAAGVPVLLADTDTRPAPYLLHSSGFTGFGGAVYFWGNTLTTGSELWKTDGTDAGTHLVKDIYPGQDSVGENLVASGGSLFFIGPDLNLGVGLWKTDGTTEGTVFLKSLTPNVGVSELTDVGGILFFNVASGPSAGLWRSDGSVEGTFLLSAGGFSGLTSFGDLLICQGTDANGAEPWKSDGTVAGTARVVDIAPGAASSSPAGFTVMSGSVYFAVKAGQEQEMWKTDGTAAGTVRILTNSGTPVARMGGHLYHLLSEQLWRTDGTTAGNELVATLPSGAAFSNACVLGSTLFFTAHDDAGKPALWKTDGTPAGASVVRTMLAEELTAMDGTLYFRGRLEDSSVSRLWKSNGTAASTILVVVPPSQFIQEYYSGLDPSSFSPIGSTLYYNASYAPPYPASGFWRTALWKSDGTAGGTTALKITGRTDSDLVWPALDCGGIGYFMTSGSGSNSSLWRSDGTPAGTSRLPQALNPGNASEFVSAGGKPFLVRKEYDGPTTLRTYDSSGNAVVLRSETAAEIYHLVESGGVLYFILRDSITGPALWKSDGTVAGTTLVKSLMEVSPEEIGPALFPRSDGGLYLFYDDGQRGMELWKSDGTAAGTTLVKDIHPESMQGTRPAVVGDILYFTGTDALHGREIWRSDGTGAGTYPLVDLSPGSEDSHVMEFTAAGDFLYFLKYNTTTPDQTLWKSDGTATGTVALMNVSPSSLTVLENRVFFAHDDGVVGGELWTSDGTPAGTHRVKDIYPGAVGSIRWAIITAHRGLVYFRANDGIHGEELWRSDGTEAGTFLAADITGDSGGSNPDSIRSIGQRLFFSATTDATGSEPYAYDPSEAPVIAALAPVAITPHGAILRGSVNAGGITTTAMLEYGTTPAYGSVATIPLVENNLLVERGFSLSLTGLAPGTVYHYRYTAVNDLGPAVTMDGSFTTLPATPLNLWLEQHDALGGAGGDKDGDAVNNLLEFACGTDPADSHLTTLAEAQGTLVVRGTPIVRGSAPDFRGLFMRRKDHAASQLVYTAQFSHDLVQWVDGAALPAVLAEDADFEVLSIAAPVLPDAPQSRFFRVKVTAP